MDSNADLGDGDTAELIENRSADRDGALGPGISAFAQLADGSVLEGALRDLSEGGAKISGATEGLHADTEIELVFVVQRDQKVLYHCVVRHVDEPGQTYGVEFLSKPEQLDPDYQPSASPPASPAHMIEACPRCEGVMELGYLAEHQHLPGRREALAAPHWAPGRPVKLVVSMNGTPKPPVRRRVDTYRCSKCGYIESYAVGPAD